MVVSDDSTRYHANCVSGLALVHHLDISIADAITAKISAQSVPRLWSWATGSHCRAAVEGGGGVLHSARHVASPSVGRDSSTLVRGIIS